jgi:hypothetical protein
MMRIIAIVAGNQHKSFKFCMDKFPVASFPADNTNKTGSFLISNQLANFARHTA